MEICDSPPRPREKLPSIFEIKNKIRLGHDECCDCYCCRPMQFPAYKYVQPEVPKSFKPLACYHKSEEPLDDNTTYGLSFWPICDQKPREKIVPPGCLAVGDGPIEDQTTQKLSYVGNWCVKPQEKILPCHRDLFGRGPMQGCSTQKHDFVWKYRTKNDPIKYPGNLCIPRGHVEGDTTYKLSYYESTCRDPVKSFKPIQVYARSDAPVDGCTTYRLSFWPNETPEKEKYPWMEKLKYVKPTTPVEDHTTYKLSYWPQCCEQAQPIRQKSAENLLNRSTSFEDDTTYKLSYFGGDGDRPGLIVPPGNLIFPECPISHDTINRMSYMGNWQPKPEKPILPCNRDLLGRGPMQDCTTQKHDYPWKCPEPNPPILPQGNMVLSQAPLEECTTQRLSYMANHPECVDQSKSYAPIREYSPSGEPMDLDTTMQLSYQPVCDIPKVEKPWAKPPPYQKPTTNIDDNTTYGLSYMLPGTIVPCNPCCPPCEPCPPCDPCRPCEPCASPRSPCPPCETCPPRSPRPPCNTCPQPCPAC